MKVLSIEQMTRLKELGVDTSKASLHYVYLPTARSIFNETDELESEPTEHLCAIFLNKKVLGMDVLSSGTIDANLLSPREIIQKALLVNAIDIVITHNHPSGDTTPSRADIDATKRLNEACNLMGLRLLDHVIIGDRRYTSLKEQGLL
jgi:DNA repair protein RadC